MTAEDEKAGKTAKLNPGQAKAVNEKLAAEKNAPAPTKTVESIEKAPGKKKNTATGTLLLHKPIGGKK